MTNNIYNIYNICIISLLPLSFILPAYAQQDLSQLLEQQYGGVSQCEFVKITEARAYIPFSIKIYHAPVSDIEIHANATVGVQVNQDLTQPTLAQIYTNQTDPNGIRVHAYMNWVTMDKAPKSIFTEIWSAGELVEVDKHTMVSPVFCRDYIVSTSIKPQQPDIKKVIDEYQRNVFSKTIDVITANTNVSSTFAFGAAIEGIVFLFIFGYVMVARHFGRKRREDKEKSQTNSIRAAVSNSAEALKNVKLMSAHMENILGKMQKEFPLLVLSKIATSVNDFDLRMRPLLQHLENLVSELRLIAVPQQPQKQTEPVVEAHVEPVVEAHVEPIVEQVVEPSVIPSVSTDTESTEEEDLEEEKSSVFQKFKNLFGIVKPELKFTKDEYKQKFQTLITEQKATRKDLRELYDVFYARWTKGGSTDKDLENRIVALYEVIKQEEME